LKKVQRTKNTKMSEERSSWTTSGQTWRRNRHSWSQNWEIWWLLQIG